MNTGLVLIITFVGACLNLVISFSIIIKRKHHLVCIASSITAIGLALASERCLSVLPQVAQLMPELFVVVCYFVIRLAVALVIFFNLVLIVLSVRTMRKEKMTQTRAIEKESSMMTAKGFTLVELLVVIAIVVILLGGGVRGFSPMGLIGGCQPNYGTRTAEGYFIDGGPTGFWFKSWEGRLQVGTETTTAYKIILECSISKSQVELIDKVEKLRGKHVRVGYRQWLQKPYWLGTANEVISIEPLGEEGVKRE